MSLIAYNKKQLVQRLRQDIANDFPDSEFSISENEVLLHIDQAIAYNVVGQIWATGKLNGGVIEVPEGYLKTVRLDQLVQDPVTKKWHATLPQPPVSLPLGYSITRCYFANEANGVSQEIMLIKAKRAGYRSLMAAPSGSQATINGSTIYISSNDGYPLFGLPVYVEYLFTRTDSMTEALNLPDDAIEGVYNLAYNKLVQRYKMPKDIVQDEIGAGNTTQKG